MLKAKKNIYGRTDNWQLHLLVLIPLVMIALFNYIPYGGIIMAFQNYKPARGILHSKWVGLQNFKLLFGMEGFRFAVRNTFIIAIGKIILNIIVPVVFSLMLNEMNNSRVKKVIQTIVYLPHFVSWVLLSSIIIRLLSGNGLVNKAIRALGGETQTFLADKNSFRSLVIITDIWKEFGYGTIIYLAAMTGIDSQLYEAAAIDGAGYWKRMLHVTLPGITNTIIIMSTLALGRILEAGFDQIFNLYSAAVYETGDIIDTFVYRMGFNNMQYSISTAAGLFKNAVSFILIVVSYRLTYHLTGYRLF